MMGMGNFFESRNWVSTVEWSRPRVCDEMHLQIRIAQLEGLLSELWAVTDEYHRLLRYHMMRRKNDKKYAELAARVRAAVRE